MRRLAIIVTLIATAARGDFVVKQSGSHVGTARDINCGTNMTCSISGVTATLSSSGSGGSGSGAPVDAGYIVLSGHSSGSTNERTLSAGNYTSIDTATTGQVQVDWAHGLTCSAGQALVSSGTSAMACTSTLIASDVQCSGTCVADAEIAAVSGAKVSGAVASATSATTASTATALASNPTDCVGGFAYAIDSSGNLTCGVVGAAEGGTGLNSIDENEVPVGIAADTYDRLSLPSCSNATTSKLLFNTTTHIFSCGTDQTGGGSGGASPLILSFGGF